MRSLRGCPNRSGSGLFFEHHPTLAKFWGPIIGPLVAMLSFVCSIGNVPLAAVLWNGGISFGGVLAFIFADLIILPILDIYRRYYGLRVAAFLLVTFYTAMALSGLAVELLFQALGLTPTERHAKIVEASITWNYTTILNIAFLALAAVLVWRFARHGRLAHAQDDERPTQPIRARSRSRLTLKDSAAVASSGSSPRATRLARGWQDATRSQNPTSTTS